MDVPADPSNPVAPHAVVTLTTLIGRPPPAVWAVLTDADRSPRWLGGFRMESPWEVGGPLRLVGTLGGHTYEETGTVRMFDPPHALCYDHWSRIWRVPDTPANRAVWTLRLTPTGAGTRVDLHHALPEVEAIAPHAAFFWRGALHQLRVLVEESDP